jgi:quinol monooxygenase YgiN
MSDQIYWILEVAIQPGMLEDFRAVAKDLIASSESEPGTLGYEYYLNADNTACHIYERYKDSAAVATHVKSFARFAERFMQSCTPTRFHIYGTPSEEVKAALAELNPVYFSTPIGGFSR